MSELDPVLTAWRAEFDGQLITPSDADYEAARRVFAVHADRRPAVVVRPTDAAQVARAVMLARESGLPIAVRSGGHSLAGHGVSDGAVIDLSAMGSVEIDPGERIGQALGGTSAGTYTAAAGRYGLATGFGDVSVVGIGGLTLGGGVGYLTRKYGLTIDSLLAAEVVTADGDVLEASEDSHPDLFWALRGGGGNFGVVTRFRFRLHDVSSVVGGMLILPARAALLQAVAEQAAAAPDELTVMCSAMTAPPMPMIPSDYHGQPVIMVMLCYAGEAEAGNQAVADFRALATPIADTVQPTTYPEMLADGPGSRPVIASSSTYIDEIDADTAELVLDRLRASRAARAAVEFRALGGAVARVPADATAFAQRDRRFVATPSAMFDELSEKPDHVAWANQLARSLGGSDGGHLNFMMDEPTERIRDAYPGATWDRLREIKRRYDPDNVFRLNQNIPPA